MTIKEIRKLTNLKQQEFADKYEKVQRDRKSLI